MANMLPNYTAYTVVKREGADDFWIAIGAAWMHQDGDGFNVVLNALPLPGSDGQCKIVLRPKVDTKEDPKAAQQTIRETNDRRKAARTS